MWDGIKGMLLHPIFHVSLLYVPGVTKQVNLYTLYKIAIINTVLVSQIATIASACVLVLNFDSVI